MKNLMSFALYESDFTVVKRQSLTGDGEYRITHKGGFLDYGVEDGAYLLELVEVPEEDRHQGVATALLDYFFKMVDAEGGLLDMTGFLEDGKKYLTDVVGRLRKKYANIEYA